MSRVVGGHLSKLYPERWACRRRRHDIFAEVAEDPPDHLFLPLEDEGQDVHRATTVRYPHFVGNVMYALSRILYG